MAEGNVGKGLRLAERLAWGIGATLLLVYVAVWAHGAIMQRQALENFEQARTAVAETSPMLESWTQLPPDRGLWSDERVRAYEETIEHDAAVPLAVLRIPGIELRVPVFDGTDELTLNRAVGRIEGTAVPGEPGNVGIAGHRDSFFRGLKDVAKGDRIELETLDGTHTYEVTEITIVDPEAVEVLDPTPRPTVTLVTCYPFYYVGSAPERYIVRAERTASGPGETETATKVRSVASASHSP